MASRVILDLCSGTGMWSYPYKKAGYRVVLVDILDGTDVRRFSPPDEVHGVLAAPPCTEFAGSGARWWKEKPPEKLQEALDVVYACLRILAECNPIWWAMENPVGRLRRFIGPPRLIFNPCEFGDPWLKKTCLWGNFTVPERRPVVPTKGQYLWRLPPSKHRSMTRSVTPPGFARAFFEANP